MFLSNANQMRKKKKKKIGLIFHEKESNFQIMVVSDKISNVQYEFFLFVTLRSKLS